MKKFKFLPYIMIMVLSVAVLVLGVYAAAPSNNTITGSISIEASSLPYAVECYIDDDLAKSQETVRGGITWTEGLSNLKFKTDSAETINDVPEIVLTFKITNKSDTPLGAYFYTGTGLDSDDLATASSIKQTDILSTGGKDYVKAYLKGYTYIAPQGSEYATQEMTVNFKLTQFADDKVDMGFTYTLRLEEYVANVSESRMAPRMGLTSDQNEIWDYEGKYILKLPDNENITAVPDMFLGGSGSGQALYEPSNYHIVIPTNYTYIGTNAFSGLWCQVAGINIPKSVKNIGFNAFAAYGYDSSMGLYHDGRIIIPEGVECIDDNAFGTLVGAEFIVPSTLKIVGRNALPLDTNKANVYNGGYYYGNEENPYVALVGATSDKLEIIHNDCTAVMEGCFRASQVKQLTEYGNCYYIGSENNPYMVLISNTGIDDINNVQTYTVHADTRYIRCNFNLEYANISLSGANNVIAISDDVFGTNSGKTWKTMPNTVLYVGSRMTGVIGANSTTYLPDSVIFAHSGVASYNGNTKYIIKNAGAISETSFAICKSVTAILNGEDTSYPIINTTNLFIPKSVQYIPSILLSGEYDSITNIYCEAQSKPLGWANDFNSNDMYGQTANVEYGVTYEQYLTKIAG